jgi:hypothetical protein
MTALKRTLVLPVLICLAATVGLAQDSKKDAQLRTVHGVVLDKTENAVSESIVYLKNDRTNVVRTLYTDTTGKFRFSGLDPNTDYEIYAQKGNAKSATHTVTSFDTRKDLTVNLKMDKKND